MNTNKSNGKMIQYKCSHKGKEQIFIVPERYEVKKVLGAGAYGMVVEAYDQLKKKNVAIKKNFNIFSHHPDDREYQKRILREIMILEHFRGHYNLIHLIDILPPSDLENFDEVYLVMELMRGDLRKQLKANVEFSDEDVQYFLYNILVGLKYIHSAGILHRDLKPSNILLDEEMTLKICDFGLSRGVQMDFDTAMSTYQVVTRWYRAPELLLMWDKNTHLAAFDMWSVGCIFAEMLQKPSRRPIFPGKNYLDQIIAILKVTGTPNKEDVRGIPKAINYLNQQPRYKPRELFKGENQYANPLGIELLRKMLHWNPEKRITVDDALAHPYLKEVRDSEIELTCKPFKFRFSDEIETSTIRKMIWDECVNWNKKYNGLYTNGFVPTAVPDKSQMIVIT